MIALSATWPIAVPLGRGGVEVQGVRGYTLPGGERHALLFEQDDRVATQLDPVRRNAQLSQQLVDRFSRSTGMLVAVVYLNGNFQVSSQLLDVVYLYFDFSEASTSPNFGDYHR
jgi:hypothetical protein